MSAQDNFSVKAAKRWQIIMDKTVSVFEHEYPPSRVKSTNAVLKVAQGIWDRFAFMWDGHCDLSNITDQVYLQLYLKTLLIKCAVRQSTLDLYRIGTQHNESSKAIFEKNLWALDIIKELGKYEEELRTYAEQKQISEHQKTEKISQSQKATSPQDSFVILTCETPLMILEERLSMLNGGEQQLFEDATGRGETRLTREWFRNGLEVSENKKPWAVLQLLLTCDQLGKYFLEVMMGTKEDVDERSELVGGCYFPALVDCFTSAWTTIHSILKVTCNINFCLPVLDPKKHVSIWDNQRHYPIKGWTHALLPTDRAIYTQVGAGGQSAKGGKDDFQLCHGWEWVPGGDWEQQSAVGRTDKDGWMYGAGWSCKSPESGKIKVCRRKMWKREQQRTGILINEMKEYSDQVNIHEPSRKKGIPARPSSVLPPLAFVSVTSEEHQPYSPTPKAFAPSSRTLQAITIPESEAQENEAQFGNDPTAYCPRSMGLSIAGPPTPSKNNPMRPNNPMRSPGAPIQPPGAPIQPPGAPIRSPGAPIRPPGTTIQPSGAPRAMSPQPPPQKGGVAPRPPPPPPSHSHHHHHHHHHSQET